ncbi:hypothetical protein GOODEAATRI_034605 [Goodea atripinnis]|uniref:Secreted protein n=1 Tax=Goodea atripinnis TaxID=208336 RepID=A0ABV0MXI3_9TELE
MTCFSGLLFCRTGMVYLSFMMTSSRQQTPFSFAWTQLHLWVLGDFFRVHGSLPSGHFLSPIRTISHYEMISISIACCAWGNLWKERIAALCDNAAIVEVNKGRSF